ncbi:MAG: NAD+ synthase, partial [Bacteroidales bacterium]|nr:NAD+ synthase [Bacteroidales bacterium]
MKIVLAQQNYIIADFKGNTEKIIESIKNAKQKKADLIVFPEMSVCGHYPYELLNNKTFLNNSQKALQEIIPHCVDIAVVIGNIVQKNQKLYNSALFIENGQISHQINKRNLINNDLLDESRYFCNDENEFETIEYLNKRIAIT